MDYRLKYRTGPRVEKQRFDSVEALFVRTQELLDESVSSAPGDEVKAPFRNYDAIEVVHGRIELTLSEGRIGKKVRGGVDVRRDGSAEAFVGRTSRSLIEPRPGETMLEALRRELLAAT